MAAAAQSPAPATPVQRWRLPPDVRMLAQMGGNREALRLIEAEIGKCDAARTANAVPDDNCLDLLITATTLAQRVRDGVRATELARRAVAAAERALPPGHLDRALARRLLASTLVQTPDAALVEYRAALALYRAADSNAQDNVIDDMVNLLNAHARYGEAEPLLRDMLDRTLARRGAAHPEVGAALTNLAINLSAQRREDEAHPLLVRALAIYEGALPPNHPHIAVLLVNVGASLIALRRPQEAVPVLRRALALREANLRTGHPDIAVALGALANALTAAGDVTGAEGALRRALDIRRAAYRTGSPAIANGIVSLAYNLGKQGRDAEAVALYREARTIYAAAYPPGHPYRINGDWSLAAALLKAGTDLAEARSHFREAGRNAAARIATHRDYGAGAVREAESWRNIFAGQAKVAWVLTPRQLPDSAQ
ncbi:tetratricopeptide repeat protein [Sphingomonas sp.]|uniref:tetratricopeptide repeat protein n=1 Tax=Sphingomonas sp. TaxID=28214 RepID=UPI003BAA126E